MDTLAEFQPASYDIPHTSLKAIHLEGVASVKDTVSFAYVITTSGTTGRPKIVKVPHACIAPNISFFM